MDRDRAVFIGLGVVIPALVIADHRTPSASSGGGGAAAPTAPAPAAGGTKTTKTAGGKSKAAAGGAAGALVAKGKVLFTQTCGSCHTLANAGTAGQVGPNLDQVKPTEQRVLNALKKGGLGSGTMPANLYTEPTESCSEVRQHGRRQVSFFQRKSRRAVNREASLRPRRRGSSAEASAFLASEEGPS